jgi:hypothetical protein
MQHIINLLKEKANLSDEQAKVAAEAVLQEFKLKFPGILHSEIDKVAAGGEFGDSAREKVEQVRDKLEEVARNAGQKAEELAAELKNKVSEMFNSGKGKTT